MRLKQWQSDTARVQKAKKLVNSDVFKDLVQMIKDESPWNVEHPPEGSTELDLARLFERGFGVNYALKLFEWATEEVKEQKQIPQDYKQTGDKE